MMGDIINEMIDNFAKQQSRDMDDAIIRFLRSKGYKPRRTEKYAKNLKRKLEKQGIELKIEEIVLEEKFTDISYYKKVIYIPSFVHIKKIGGINGHTKDI